MDKNMEQCCVCCCKVMLKEEFLIHEVFRDKHVTVFQASVGSATANKLSNKGTITSIPRLSMQRRFKIN